MAGHRHRVSDEPETIEDDGLRFRVSGDYVAFGMGGAPLAEGEWSPSGRFLPAWVEFELDGRDEPDFYCRVELRDDVPRVVELGWCARESQSEIRQKHLRAAEVAALVNEVYGTWAVELRDVWRDTPGMAIPTEIGTEQERVIRGFLHDLRTGRRHVNAELLRQVAQVYRANFDKAPAEAVARTFGVKQRMAHEYVRRARERGFLPPTTQGKKKI
ncbi:hypothetical protein [Mycobacterium sp.]|uniref:hypothetical protein n=1 Tax=Mycobacterium sp. TaxID=1785 RepID=UPI003D6C2FD5